MPVNETQVTLTIDAGQQVPPKLRRLGAALSARLKAAKNTNTDLNAERSKESPNPERIAALKQERSDIARDLLPLVEEFESILADAGGELAGLIAAIRAVAADIHAETTPTPNPEA